jgi:23S rRNA (uracil1939-C5)-methyltransferase
LVQIEITGINHRGEGVGRHEGKVYFVPFTVPGDVVEVEPGKQAKRYGFARLKEVIRPSVDRVTPRCEQMERCGGSNLHNIDYQAQLELKRRLVADALERIGNLGRVEVLPTIGMENPYHYRSKAVFHVQTDPLAIGFFQTGSHTVVPIRDCLLVPPGWGDILNFLEHSLRHIGSSVQDLSQIMLRESHNHREIMLILYGRNKLLRGQVWERLAQDIRQHFQRVSTVASTAGHDEVVILSGRGFLNERLAGLEFAISPMAFFQVNTVMAEVLVQKVLQYGQPADGELVIDAYCGIGTLSLPLACHADKVIGIEQNPAAVSDARHNAEINNIGNAEFISGDFEKVLARIAPSIGVADLLVVDPPRRGLTPKILQSIADVKPRRMVYVSCNPGTLARDLSSLTSQGYEVKEVQPVDMFPHTAHVECVVLMSRVDK